MLSSSRSERRARFNRALNRGEKRRRVERASPDQLKRLFSYLKPYRGRLVLGLIAMLVGAGIALVIPLVIQRLVDVLLETSTLRPIHQVTISLIVIFFFRAVFYFIEGYYLAYIGEKVVLDIRRDLYTHLHTLTLRFFSDRGVGEIVSRLSVDVSSVREAISMSIANALRQSLTFIGALVIMLVVNWKLTGIILLIAPPVAIIAILFGRRFQTLTMIFTDVRARGTALAEQAISSVRVVKAFTRESYEVERFKENLDDLFKVSLRRVVWRATFSSMITFLGFSTVALILWWGGRWVALGRLSPGELISFLFYAMMIASSLTVFSSVYEQVTSALGATRRIFDLLDERSEIVQIPDAIKVDKVRLQGKITYENVHFSYATERGLIQDFSLEVQPGELLALVGPSGAGKTTLVNLIPRFFDPQSGRILLDDVDLKTLDIKSLREMIGLVPQEIDLFSGTLRENLLYGRLDAADEEIIEASIAANAWEFIKQSPDKLDTYIGERGLMLSTGQRQRIAIARAVLKDPRILLLDEATSSLDSESEKLVQEALERLMEGRTSLVIAHRLSTIYKADRIAVINKGKLIELGKHEELVGRDGLYARLHAIQFQDLTNNNA
jgi:subfamily B ATP-binding cassette protein MsbA